MSNEERELYRARRFAVVEQCCITADGMPATCQFVRHPGSVAILPIIDNEHVCLIRSRRLTVGETLIELPAGTREPGEPPLETARRELAEETGYLAAHFDELLSYFPSPGVMDERMWVFVAHGLMAGAPHREPNEEIENLVVSWEEALAMIDRGQIRDGKTILTLLIHERQRQTRGRRS